LEAERREARQAVAERVELRQERFQVANSERAWSSLLWRAGENPPEERLPQLETFLVRSSTAYKKENRTLGPLPGLQLKTVRHQRSLFSLRLDMRPLAI
jgi:hypothetical protein